jgi:hypothetical protein
LPGLRSEATREGDAAKRPGGEWGRTGLRTTLWIATGGGILGFLLLLPTPLPGYRMLA